LIYFLVDTSITVTAILVSRSRLHLFRSHGSLAASLDYRPGREQEREREKERGGRERVQLQPTLNVRGISYEIRASAASLSVNV